MKEKAILIFLGTKKRDRSEAKDSMRELKGLAMAAGTEVVQEVFQFKDVVSPKFLIGKGKVEELLILKEGANCSKVTFSLTEQPQITTHYIRGGNPPFGSRLINP